MAIVSCVWNLIHPFPFLRQRTCSILLSFVSRNALWHGKSFCYEMLKLFHCFYCRLAYSSLRTRSEWGFGIRWNIELATFLECLYFQLANLNFNSHFASLQAWVSSPAPVYKEHFSYMSSCWTSKGENLPFHSSPRGGGDFEKTIFDTYFHHLGRLSTIKILVKPLLIFNQQSSLFAIIAKAVVCDHF